MFGGYAAAIKIGAVVLVLVLAGMWLHLRDQSFYRQGAAHVQAQWDAYKAQVDALAAAKAAERDAIEAQGRARNAEILKDLAGKLDAAATDRDSIAQRLRIAAAKAAACGSNLPAPATGPGHIPPSGSAGNATLDGLLADALTECRVNADRQDAMIDSLTAQSR